MALKLVPNSEKYWEFIRMLRNMDGVKQGFIEQKEISEEEQQKYMLKYNNCFYVCIDNDIPVGYVGIIKRDIRVATHPKHQGKKIGQFMLQELLKLHPDAYAKIKIDNTASLRLFENCGFKLKYYILEREL